MELKSSVKKILCDGLVAALATTICGLIESDPDVFTDDQLKEMTRLDEEWLAATKKVVGL